MENQQKNIPMGRLHGVLLDIDGVNVITYFEVIEIIDDSNIYLDFLGIDWPFDMDAIINFK